MRRHSQVGKPMFENLSDRLSQAARNISGKGRLSESNIKDTLRQVRLALLVTMVCQVQTVLTVHKVCKASSVLKVLPVTMALQVQMAHKVCKVKLVRPVLMV